MSDQSRHPEIVSRDNGIPASDEPYWFRNGRRFANFQSNAELPPNADVVVIGAGLTGASSVYHLTRAMGTRRMRIVILDQGDPAGEASGRNGGTFELLPENSVGAYEGLARERLQFLRRVYPGLPAEILRAESARQASLVLGIALRNRDLMRGIVLREGIDCDFTPKGWLHLANSDEEEQGICEEVVLAAQHGQRIEIWSRAMIRRELGIDNEFVGRFVPEDGTYHPFKYVCGLLDRALAAGAELYTRTGVHAVESDDQNRHRIVTDRGTIVAGRVIVATNAFTASLFPELSAIRPHQSQIQFTENARDRARGRAITSEAGPVFFTQPREGARRGKAPLLMGGGADRPMRNPASRRRSPTVHRLLLTLRNRFFPELDGVAPTSEWIGPLAFTPDRLPAIGYLREGVIMAAGFNGYGGSYTTASGYAAAEIALTDRVPEWVPEDVFAPRRFMQREPLFMTEHDSLWRIAASLCRQLKNVNRRISEALTLRKGSAETIRVNQPHSILPRAESGPGNSLAPELLLAFPAFACFTTDEIQMLLSVTRKWELPAGTLLFSEGSPGGSCFIIVRGAVDVSIEVKGSQQLLAHLPEGNVFGQVSVIDGEPRTATCTVQCDAILVELELDACERLLAAGSPLSLKLLGVLNDGLISALRGADRTLLKIGSDRGRSRWAR